MRDCLVDSFPKLFNCDVRDLRCILHSVHTATVVTVAGQGVRDIAGRCRIIDDGDASAIGNCTGGIRVFPAGDSSQVDANSSAVPAHAGPVCVLSGQ